MSEGRLVFYESFVDDSDFPNWYFDQGSVPRLNSALQLPGDPERGAMDFGAEGESFPGADREIPLEPGKQYWVKLVYELVHSGHHNRNVRVLDAAGAVLWADNFQGSGSHDGVIEYLVPDEGLTPDETSALQIHLAIRGTAGATSHISVGHIEVRDLTAEETPGGGAAGPVTATASAAGASARWGGAVAPAVARAPTGGRARRAGGADAVAMLSGKVEGASVRRGGGPAQIAVTAAAGGQDVSDAPSGGTIAPLVLSAVVGGRASRSGGMAGALVVAGRTGGSTQRRGGAPAGAIVSAEGAGRSTRHGGTIAPVVLPAEASGRDPTHRPDVQATVPGVWMRRKTGGTWQRRTAQGTWRRAS